ncbi:hypothetical protein CC1G_04779 [Coprinopsis cinerea okayama7|uniref:Nephrocystin 3-like N-terminal domain-containing protein n=1 Tax=Coprinopsis cinerea (strain Okayama-7 / 130 / ATCC MYA-4618 / FGSC 9003) TaxID=240176 RepID=A8P2J3_COPC7|nr:hypothetical protein CC1G_04779 [Coprinopsis cinerea okayama7\|eukprot:XP_001838335.2 hypothetical protein CC1G_04779 [Coprinopsis cinerea okayama7\
MFTQSQNFVVQGGEFFNSEKLYRVVNREPKPDPFDLLHRHRAVQATHKSPLASYAAKCKSGTRKEVINDIISWTNRSDDTPILWFSGPAGGGKTCIQRDVARQAESSKSLAASYFFSSSKRNPGLDSASPFVATIVHQFIYSIPEMKHYVARVLRDRPDIFEESLDVQLEALVLDILPKLSKQALAKAPRSLIIDGLDECRDASERQHLLRLLRTLVSNSYIPFRVVVASRPELDIRTTFNTVPLRSVAHHVRLDDYDGTSDIRSYFCDEFTRIRECHPSASSIPDDWPPEEDVELLVAKASSQFIFAATVIRFVDYPKQNPVTLLQHVLSYTSSVPSSLKGGDDNPFSELDALYTMILLPSVYANPRDSYQIDIPLLRRLLHTIMVMIPPQGPIPTQSHQLFLDKFLSLPPGTTDMTICDLHSLLKVPKPHYSQSHPPRDSLFSGTGSSSMTPDSEEDWVPLTPIQFHHKSMEDYLCSPKRSGILYQSREDTNIQLAECCAFHLMCWEEGDDDTNSNPSPRSSSTPMATGGILPYSYEHWEKYLMEGLSGLTRETSPFKVGGTATSPLALAREETLKARRNASKTPKSITNGEASGVRDGQPTPEKALPVALQNLCDFDPMIIVRYRFLHCITAANSEFPFTLAAHRDGRDVRLLDVVHELMCYDAFSGCTKLCKRLNRLERHWFKAARFFAQYEERTSGTSEASVGHDISSKMELLPLIDNLLRVKHRRPQGPGTLRVRHSGRTSQEPSVVSPTSSPESDLANSPQFFNPFTNTRIPVTKHTRRASVPLSKPLPPLPHDRPPGRFSLALTWPFRKTST